MDFITLNSGKRVSYEEGYLRFNGIEIIANTIDLTPEEQKEFSNKLKNERDVAVIFFGQTHNLIEAFL